MAVKLICFYSQKICIVTIAFFAKEAHLKRTAVYCGKSGLCLSNQIGSKKRVDWTQYKTVSMAANASWGTCCAPVGKVCKVWLDNTVFSDAGGSCAFSVGFFSTLFLFLLSTSRRLHRNSTLRLFRLHTRPHLFVPNLKNSDEHLDP